MFNRFTATVLLLSASLLLLANPQQAVLTSNKEIAQRLVQEASATYMQKEYPESAALYLYAIDRGARDQTTLYNAACSLALSKDLDKAWVYLGEAIDAGFRDVQHLREDSDLTELHLDKRWSEMVARCERTFASYKKDRTSPDKAKWVTSDIDLFWKAYALTKKQPADKWALTLQKEYFEKGSDGLTEFETVRRITPARMAEYLKKHPKFFSSVEASTKKIAGMKGPIRDIYARMKRLYPETLYPDVYFCVGPFSGGGTVSEKGLLLSAEMVSGESTTARDELSSWEKSVLSERKDITPMVAHELVHFQQRYSPNDHSLLRACIQEGSASFIGKLTSETMVKREREQHTYGDAHEEELWGEFKDQMDGTDTKKWLYGGSGGGTKPDDLGYYIGYRICEAYYEAAEDKKQAIADILNIPDFHAFLKASGYGEKFGRK